MSMRSPKTKTDNTAVGECHICFDIYDANTPSKVPKLLDCAHTFCAECLEKLLKANGFNQIKCPNGCADVTEVRSIKGLKNNFALIELLGYVLDPDEQKAKCDNCGSGLAELFCQDCQSNLCADCSGQIHSFGIFKHHKPTEGTKPKDALDDLTKIEKKSEPEDVTANTNSTQSRAEIKHLKPLVLFAYENERYYYYWSKYRKEWGPPGGAGCIFDPESWTDLFGNPLDTTKPLPGYNWGSNWETVVSDETDLYGWQYAFSFQNKFVKTHSKLRYVRRREWRRKMIPNS